MHDKDLIFPIFMDTPEYTRYRPEVTENTSDEFVARTDFFRYIFRTPVFGHLLPVTSDTGSISPLSPPYS